MTRSVNRGINGVPGVPLQVVRKESNMTKLRKRLPKTAVALTLVALLALVPLTAVFADSPGTGGQPNQSCEDIPLQPGNSISAPGSAFNPNGMAGTVYAGEQPQNSVNPKAVSQYDVACFEQQGH
jgi:hypothetical protein